MRKLSSSYTIEVVVFKPLDMPEVPKDKITTAEIVDYTRYVIKSILYVMELHVSG